MYGFGIDWEDAVVARAVVSLAPVWWVWLRTSLEESESYNDDVDLRKPLMFREPSF